MIEQLDSVIQFDLSAVITYAGLAYQILSIELVTPDRLITPENLKSIRLPVGIDARVGMIVSGRAPIWLYCYLVHELHPVAWVACFDPRIGAVVVATHTHQVQVGEVIPLEAAATKPIQDETLTLCPGLMVVGPPDSGKSVFSFALFKRLIQKGVDVYLQRAQWDGEGNYLLEAGLPENLSSAQRGEYKSKNRGELSQRFFPFQAQAILNLRRQKSLVIVDVGGMVQPEKVPILEACSHYLVISAQPETVSRWHEFCHGRGNLAPVGVIHSRLGPGLEVYQEYPFWEISAGPWRQDVQPQIPGLVMTSIEQLVRENGINS